MTGAYGTCVVEFPQDQKVLCVQDFSQSFLAEHHMPDAHTQYYIRIELN